MNRTCFCLVFSALLFSYGCVEHLSRAQSREQKSKPQAITGKVDAKFPQFLVGVWQADAFNWAFKFEPDGKISKLTHVLGVPMKVEEGSYYEQGTENSFGLYVLGPCDTSYDPKSKVLKVSVVLEYFRMEFPTAGSIEGSEKDLFEGPVSANPLRRGRTAAKDLFWNVKWRSYSNIEGASPPDVNEIDANPENLVFRKLDLEKFEEHKHQPAPPVRQHGE